MDADDSRGETALGNEGRKDRCRETTQGGGGEGVGAELPMWSPASRSSGRARRRMQLSLNVGQQE